jgi:hypothetical protein
MIAGISYWLPHTGNVASSWMLDIDKADFDAFAPTQPTQTKIALHGQIIY